MKERRTRQLSAVADVVNAAHDHPSADEVHRRVRHKLPRVSLGTVYRNLQKLVGDKRLKVLTLGRSQRFDPMIDRHDHFICEKCNRVYDIVVKSGEKVLSPSLPRRGFRITSHQLTLYGICKSCAD